VPSAVDIAIAGQWIASVAPNKRWAGEVRSDRPFVTLLLATTPERLFWAKTEVCPSVGAQLVLDVHPLSWSTPETQLIFRVHDGWIQDVVVSMPSQQEVQPYAPGHALAGALLRVFNVASRPATSLELVILAREDVRLGRSGVWRPREGSLPSLPVAVMHALKGGRAGSLDLSSAAVVA
jgi:hypothetical protein